LQALLLVSLKMIKFAHLTMRRLLLLLVLLLPLLASARKREGKELIDSLCGVLRSATTDTQRSAVMSRLAAGYCYTNPDTGIILANKAMEMAKAADWELGTAKALTALGDNYLAKFDNSRALRCFMQASPIFQKCGSKKEIAACLGNISNVYSSESNYPAALDYNFRSLSIFEGLNDKADMAINLSNIGVIYRNQSDYAKAVEYSYKALDIAQHEGILSIQASVYGNLGNVYMDRCIYDTALIFDLKGLELARRQGDDVKAGNRMVTVGNAYMQLGRYATALGYFDSALAVGRSFGNQMIIAESYGSMGDCYLMAARDTVHPVPANMRSRQENLDKSVKYLLQAREIAVAVADMDDILPVNKSLSEAYALQGNFREARSSYKDYISARDSVYSEDNNVKIADLETSRNLDIKDKDIQIEQLKARNKRSERVLYIAGIIILLMLLVIIARRLMTTTRSNQQLSREQRKHLNRIQAQGDVLKDIARMQSHELRGPVSTLLGLAKLFNFERPDDPHNLELMRDITNVTERLDSIVTDVVSKENEVNAPDISTDGPAA